MNYNKAKDFVVVHISRTGKFNYLDNPIPMKGFMGYKYIEIDG